MPSRERCARRAGQAAWFAVIVAVTTWPVPVRADEATTAQAQGVQTAVAPYIGSRDTLRQNLGAPLLSNAPLTGFDGRQFDAQLGCPGSAHYLEILAQPGASGDLSTVLVSQDLDLDGSMERQYTLPMAVSGVCADGIVTCQPGTWDQCQGWAWEAAGDGGLSLSHRGLTTLGGCYCINSHCGQNLAFSNLAQVLRSLGGGAAGAMMAANPLYAVSRAAVEGPVIRYYGQQLQGCNGATGTAWTSLRNNPAAILGTAQSLASGGDAVYRTVIDSPSATQRTTQRLSCDIHRRTALESLPPSAIIAHDGGDGAVRACTTPSCIELVLGRVGDDYWSGYCSVFEHSTRFVVLRPDRIRSATLVRAVWDDWIQVLNNDQLIWDGPRTGEGLFPPETAGACELSTSWNQYPNVDFTPLLKQGGAQEFKVRVSVAGGGEGYAYAQVLVDSLCDVHEWIDDGCQALAADAQCRLETQFTDGAETFRNYNPTGLRVLPSAQTLSDAVCSETVTRDWWHKRRTYLCDRPQNWDLAAAARRNAVVTGSASASGYRDERLVDGQWQSTTAGLALPSVPDVATCVRSCKTRRAVADVEVGLSGPAADGRRDALRFEERHYVCDANDVCPLEPGETLDTPCGCLSDFGEAASFMATVRMAGSDLKCSSGATSATP